MTDTKQHNHIKLSPEESPKVKQAKPERLKRPKKRPKKEQQLKQTGKTAPAEALKRPTPDSKQKIERAEISREIIDELRDMSKERRIKNYI